MVDPPVSLPFTAPISTAQPRNSPTGEPEHESLSWGRELSIGGIQDTDRGLLLLAAGLFIGAIPTLSLVGLVLSTIGAIFVVIGKDVFYDRHPTYVVVSAITYVTCFIVLFLLGLTIRGDVNSALSSTDPATALNDVVYAYFVSFAVVGIVLGLATVLFTYAIQDRKGKILLWIALSAGILLLIPGFMLANQLPQAISQAIALRDTSAIASFIDQWQALRFWQIIPAFFYAVAYLNARSRVTNGDVP